jgi:hypothetical protein
MSTVASFRKFNYLLRPAKQVERKLFIEALHALSGVGYGICDYTYVGMGSVYYADFILFHKYLYIKRMICAERSENARRMKFNRPYAFIDLRLADVADVVASLSRDEPYVVWLDYDYPPGEELLSDVAGVVSRVVSGSVFMVTVEADWGRLVSRGDHEIPRSRREKEESARQANLLGRYHPDGFPAWAASQARLPEYYSEVLRNVCTEKAARGGGRRFVQLFNCHYADGARMLSYGGIVESDHSRIRQLSAIKACHFINRSRRPLEIAVPLLTVREKLHLERRIRSGRKLRAKELDLSAKEIRDFEHYYMHYPAYFETLI